MQEYRSHMFVTLHLHLAGPSARPGWLVVAKPQLAVVISVLPIGIVFKQLHQDQANVNVRKKNVILKVIHRSSLEKVLNIKFQKVSYTLVVIYIVMWFGA